MVSKIKEAVLIEKTKKLSVKEACAYSVMDGFGLRYVTPYALAVGASNTQIGLLSSVPGLLGNLSQLFTFGAMKRWARKKIIFSGVLLQAIMWLLLILAGIPFFLWGIKTDVSPNAIIIIYTLLIMAGAFSGPAWTSLMGDLVVKDRGKYFGNRSRAAGVVSLICMLIAGFLLDYFKQTHVFIGFAILFAIAFIGRFISAILFLKHYEPKFVADQKKYFSILDFIKKMRYNNFGRFVIYFSLLTLACSVAAPFFTVYLLKNLGFSYTQYMVVILCNSVISYLSMPLWGKFADKYGGLRVMQITGWLIAFVPLLWVFSLFFSSTSAIWIYFIFAEVFSGLVWAGFNLAAGNFIYEAVSRERLSICSSYYNIINGFGGLVGALAGGFLSSHGVSLFGLHPIIFLFILSFVFRFVVHWYMSKKIREVREVRSFNLEKHIVFEANRLKVFMKNILRSVSVDKFFASMVSESEHLLSSRSAKIN